jgi:arsenical pump membrane protein
LLAELARQEGLFEWLAAKATRHANGSATRLFTLVFAVGIVVTVFLSNDATAVVLTPAVAAVVRAAKVKQKLPYLFVCAFIANAASFVLPISNPANLVIYGSHMPPLAQWLPRYALPSVLSIIATYAMLWITQRRFLRDKVSSEIEAPELSIRGRIAALGIAGTACVLLLCSALDIRLGLPAFLSGLAAALAVLPRSTHHPLTLAKNISWAILPLVAGLFVLVEALEKTGLIVGLASILHRFAQFSETLAAWITGVTLAISCNLMNNLPAGLVSGRVVEIANMPDHVRAAVLIGVDLGPNLSVTGSLATILWLTALRREGETVDTWTFFRVGAVVMLPALVLALAGAFVVG